MSLSNSIHSELKKVQALCSPLEHLKINTFFQLRIFSTGESLVLSNSLAVYSAFESEQAIGDYFFQLIENSLYGAISVILWPSPSTDTLLSQLHERNVHHGMSISYTLDGYIEIFSFATNQPDEAILNVYLNNLSLLKRFIVYFRFKSRKILERKIDQNFFLNKKLKLSGNVSHTNLEGLSRFKDKIFSSYINAMLLKKLNKEVTLTEKEAKCLTHLLAGKTIKNMADELNVSCKTVTVYLKNIRIKTGVYTKDQLVSIFSEDEFLSEII